VSSRLVSEAMSGRQIHHYTIEATLDKDRFQGRDTRSGRDVLLVRLPELTDEVAAVLEAELTRLASLRPPGIAEVLGVHREDDGLWVITARLDGPTLAEQLRSRPLEVSTAGALAAVLLPGLAQAHASRLIHRDIHPARVQMTPLGPCLSGFGLALTEGGSVHYMAPELWRSRAHPTPASDVYALGVTLYEALTGALPFPRGLPRSTYARLHAGQGIPHVAERRPDTPDWLAQAIYKATRIKPSERFADAGEMLRAIQSAQARPAVPAAPVASAAPAREPAAKPAAKPRPAGRGRLAVMGCLGLPLLGLLGAGAVGGGWWVSQQPGGISGILHDGPVLLASNPSDQRVTISCTSGPAQSRTAAILEPGEDRALLIAGVPVSCTAFNDDRKTLLNWGTDALPAEGVSWEMSVGSIDDTGLIEPTPSEPVAAEAEDTGLTFEEGVVEDIVEPAPAPRRPRAPSPEPEVQEQPSLVSLTIRADSSWKRWGRDVRVSVDGLEVGIAPIELGVEPGRHTIRWFRESRVDHTCTVEIGEDGGTVGIDPAEPRCP
jgi:hypothetical protein